MVEDFLEFRGGLAAILQAQERQSTNVKRPIVCARALGAQFIFPCGFEYGAFAAVISTKTSSGVPAAQDASRCMAAWSPRMKAISKSMEWVEEESAFWAEACSATALASSRRFRLR